MIHTCAAVRELRTCMHIETALRWKPFVQQKSESRIMSMIHGLAFLSLSGSKTRMWFMPWHMCKSRLEWLVTGNGKVNKKDWAKGIILTEIFVYSDTAWLWCIDKIKNCPTRSALIYGRRLQGSPWWINTVNEAPYQCLYFFARIDITVWAILSIN